MPFTPERVAAQAGISAADLRATAELFALQSRRGGVNTGTGPNMAPRSNLSEHLIQCIEVVCGRFKRPGDRVTNADPLGIQQDYFAEVVPPFAPWDLSPPSRIRGVGNLFGEKLTGTLAEEILTPGPGQIRAMIVDGANIANSVPGKADIVAALKSLELLVVIDPGLTPTAQLADYVIAPKLQFERDDLPLTLGINLHMDSWVQYTPAIVPPPAGSEVVDDWYIFWSIAKRMGLALNYGETLLDMETPPTTNALLAIGMQHAALSFDELVERPGHIAVDPVPPRIVQPARSGNNARLRVNPEGVLDELSDVAREMALGEMPAFDFRLQSRRMRDVNGSIGMQAPSIRHRNPRNPLHMHPIDMARLGLEPATPVEVVSADGRIRAVVQPDDSLRERVVSMSHNWGSLEEDPEDWTMVGSSTNALISPTNNYEALNAMPRMSAIPVNVARLAAN